MLPGIKAAAFLAVPDVIKGGEIVETQRQWKSRLYDTAVIVFVEGRRSSSRWRGCN